MKRVLLWDWDGTLFDSLQFKYEDIWGEVFADEPDLQEVIRRFLKTREGQALNRYGLIRHALYTSKRVAANLTDEEMKGNPLVQTYAARYSAAADRQVSAGGLFAGAKETLRHLHQKGYHQYLISGGGSDHDLQGFVLRCGLDGYFSGIFGFGQPSTSLTSFGKEGNLLRVMECEDDTDPSRYLLIGDSESDKSFAQKSGCAFIGIANRWNGWLGDNKRVVAHVADVEHLLP